MCAICSSFPIAARLTSFSYVSSHFLLTFVNLRNRHHRYLNSSRGFNCDSKNVSMRNQISMTGVDEKIFDIQASFLFLDCKLNGLIEEKKIIIFISE